MSTYLDYNASAPIDQRVLDVMIEVYKGTIGNADSRTHNHGETARLVVENARKQVAELLGISPGEVFFTSGSTESNNIAIQGLMEYAEKTGKKHIITTSIEHKAILETVKALEKRGYDIELTKLPNLAAMQEEYGKLQAQKEALYADYGKLKKQVKEYDVIKQNIDNILRQGKEPERKKGKERE